VPCSRQQFRELQLRPGANHATQQQFYEVQLGLGVTPAAVYRDGPLRQFDEVLRSERTAVLFCRRKVKGSRLLLSGLDGCDGRGADGVQVAANGLDGCTG